MSNKNIAAAHVLCRRLVSPFCQSVPSLPPYIFSSVKIPVACPCQILNGFSGTKLRQCLTSSCPQSWGKILLPIVWHSACRGWNKIPCFQKLAIHICSVYLQIKILYIYIRIYPPAPRLRHVQVFIWGWVLSIGWLWSNVCLLPTLPTSTYFHFKRASSSYQVYISGGKQSTHVKPLSWVLIAVLMPAADIPRHVFSVCFRAADIQIHGIFPRAASTLPVLNFSKMPNLNLEQE